MKIKLGILGCGMIGLSFIKQAIKCDNYEIVAICSRTESSIKSAQKYLPTVKTYLKKEDMLADENIDAIIVCTPHASHAKDAILSLQAGKHVLIEKPIATNIDELNELLLMASKLPHLSILALPHEEHDFIKYTRELIKNEVVGKVTSMHSYLDVPGPPRSNWYYDKSAIGGASLDTLPYALMRLLKISGLNVATAVGVKNQLITHRCCGDGFTIKPEVDDNASLVLLFKTGQQAIIRSNWNISQPEDYIIIQGRKGWLHIDCWRNIINIHSENISKIDKTSLEKIADNHYRVTFEQIHPETSKLNLFDKYIRSKTSNLFEIAYGMQLILELMNKNGSIDIPKEYYLENEYLNSMKITEEYI